MLRTYSLNFVKKFIRGVLVLRTDSLFLRKRNLCWTNKRKIYKLPQITTNNVIWGVFMTKNQERKNVTIHLNSELYNLYSEYCKKEGIIMSRQIEKFIEGELNNVK